MRYLKILVLFIFSISLTIPIPDLIGRESSASQAILGRYSSLYALVLASYLAITVLWWLALLGEIGWTTAHEITHRIIRNTPILLLMMILFFAYFLVLMFLLAIWRLPLVVIQATYISIFIGPCALVALAHPKAQQQFKREGVLALISIGFSLFLVEILFRILVPYGITPDPIWLDYGQPTEWRQYVGWALRNNGYFINVSPDEFMMPIATNSKGLRDDEYPYEKPMGVFRILIIGDSGTYAQEVPIEETWHSILERRLNAVSDQPIEIIAAGIGGWSNDQQLLYLRYEGCRYQPDLVVLQFTGNDVGGNLATYLPKPYYTLNANDELELHNFPYTQGGTVYDGQIPVNHLIARSRTAMVLWNLISGFASEYSQGDVLTQTTAPAEFIPPSDDADWLARNWILTDRLIREIQQEAHKCDANFVAFAAPATQLLNSNIKPDEQMTASILVAFETTLAESQIPHPPNDWLIEPFVQHIADGGTLWDLTWPYAAHYTTLGYDLLGNRLADWFINEKIIPLS